MIIFKRNTTPKEDPAWRCHRDKCERLGGRAGASKSVMLKNCTAAEMPRGMTKILQPLDIAVKRSFEAVLQRLWEASFGDAWSAGPQGRPSSASELDDSSDSKEDAPAILSPELAQLFFQGSEQLINHVSFNCVGCFVMRGKWQVRNFAMLTICYEVSLQQGSECRCVISN